MHIPIPTSTFTYSYLLNFPDKPDSQIFTRANTWDSTLRCIQSYQSSTYPSIFFPLGRQGSVWSPTLGFNARPGLPCWGTDHIWCKGFASSHDLGVSSSMGAWVFRTKEEVFRLQVQLGSHAPTTGSQVGSHRIPCGRDEDEVFGSLDARVYLGSSKEQSAITRHCIIFIIYY